MAPAHRTTRRVVRRSTLLAAALLLACSSGTSSSGGNATGICAQSGRGCLTGNLVAAGSLQQSGGSMSGTAVGGAVVKVNGTQVATANDQGWWYASGVPSGDPVSVCFSKPGYVTRCRNVTLRSGQSLDVSTTEIKQQAAAQSVTPSSGGTVAPTSAVAPAGTAQVTIPASALCQGSAGGARSTATVSCSLTPIDVTQPSQRSLAPGDFTGVDSSGQPVRLVTGGVMDITCTDAVTGAPVQLCTGQTAAARIPIYSGCGDTTVFPATMSSWDYDEVSGRWVERGALAKTCNGSVGYYAGTVSHFSPWNADMPASTGCLRGKVVNDQGAAVDGAVVRCDGTDRNWSAEGYSGADGTFCMSVAASSAYRCTAYKGTFGTDAKTGTTPAAGGSCGGSGCSDMGTFSLHDPIARITLTWKAAPRDLDSHTFGPNDVHVYYSAKGSLNAAPFVNLDTDDTGSYGPEITTFVPGVAAGTYRFCVHNYSNEVPLAGAADYGATVNVTTATGIVRTYDVPGPGTGQRVWRVFDLTVAGNAVTAVRDIGDLQPTDGSDVATACKR
jgi:hypothetical protein